MKRTVLFMVMLLPVSLLFAQKQSPSGHKNPDEQIKVKKQYDEQGNLIGYDSTYIRSWSSDTTMTSIDPDDMRREMEHFFRDDFRKFFSDSTAFGDDLQEKFLQQFQNFRDQFDQDNDSTQTAMPGMPSFSDFDKLRDEMMQHFRESLPEDTVKIQGAPDAIHPGASGQLKEKPKEPSEQDQIIPQQMKAPGKANKSTVFL